MDMFTPFCTLALTEPWGQRQYKFTVDLPMLRSGKFLVTSHLIRVYDRRLSGYCRHNDNVIKVGSVSYKRNNNVDSISNTLIKII